MLDVHEFRGETTVIVAPAELPKVMQFLRDTSGLIYNYLSDISAVDYWGTVRRHRRPPGAFWGVLSPLLAAV